MFQDIERNVATLMTDSTKLKTDLGRVESDLSSAESDLTRAREDLRRVSTDVSANDGEINKAKTGAYHTHARTHIHTSYTYTYNTHTHIHPLHKQIDPHLSKQACCPPVFLSHVCLSVCPFCLSVWMPEVQRTVG